MSKDNLVGGVHTVTRLLQAHPERLRLIEIDSRRDDAAIAIIAELANTQGIAVQRCKSSRLESLVGELRHQGVVAHITPARLLDDQSLSELLAGQPQPLLLALDEVQDPHNLGACLRTAEAVGADAVVIPQHRAAGVNATVRKVASGAADFVPIAVSGNLSRTLDKLKGIGVWCYGAAVDGDKSLYEIDFTGPVCLVMGGEAKGLRRLVGERCDELFRIPMEGQVQSLNVSVAAAVCLYEAVRQRGAANIS